ncbi:MAG: PQQ-binding-like beta-propeller repeat protein [Deltaproteobacteria bacterium]|nr:PQQ-binding-like beta-propeller repeat protein [Deltaproteobacteria bacterium]
MRTSPLPPSPASAASPGFQAGPRLAGRGRALKRLAFEQAWQQVVPGADRLLLDRADGITAWGRTGLGAFTPGGRPRLELRGLDGLAVAPGGAYAVLREGEALVGLRLDGRLPGRALWRRSPSTLVPREPLVSGSATLFLLSAGQGALGLASHTGREQWRLQLRGGTWPLGAQGRCWLTTELGSVLQVHPDSGAVGAAVHCPLPFHGPANLHGRQLSAVASDADRSELMVLDAASGEPLLRRALALGRAGPAVPLARRWFLAGERAGEARILALTASGRTVWERPLPFAGPWRLLPCAGGLLATNRAGAAVCVETTGKLRWTAGSGAPDETEQPLAPAVRRGVAFAFGPEVRALDARSGGLLAALPLKAPAVAAAVGRSLDVYVLDESGRLTAWRLATHLSAVRRG